MTQKWPIRACQPGHSDWLVEKTTNKSSQLEHCPELSRIIKGLLLLVPKLQSRLRAEWLFLPQSVESLPEKESQERRLRGMWREKFLTLSGHQIQLYLRPTLSEIFFSVIKLNHIQLPIFYNFWLKKDNFISFDSHETTNSLSHLNKFKLSFWLLQLEESCPIHTHRPRNSTFTFGVSPPIFISLRVYVCII